MLLPIKYIVSPGPGTVPYPYATTVEDGEVIHLKEISTNVNDLRVSPPGQPTLMHSGFEVLWESPSKISYDEFGIIIGSDERFEVTERYRTETSEQLKSHLGASRVVVWNHHIRRSGIPPETEPDHPNTTLPASRAHVDQSDKRAREVLGHELGFKTSEKFREWVARGGRAALVNIWRPLKGPVRFAPLLVCDGRSLRPTELKRCHDYFGEHFSLEYHESQRWYLVSDQMPSEPILILCYDSAADPVLNPELPLDYQRAACCPHTASVSPKSGDKTETETRESIEVRTYVFWDPPGHQKTQ
ncbi:hypothetical protein CROQUDRAFT_657815 [Cronartium quercuum f. sp. fusiforme G11]|uniref:Uncharacterized protein n=1 Tax=Cronartium quercuum f. sp. fusiforme G11 TaxID=708437 RepID=A0A9P6TBE1_9BASI|nr:hypothetical protein CROQUDRAFT_657815 [Cronartium quercuum f. sp. fusiforme G11]